MVCYAETFMTFSVIKKKKEEKYVLIPIAVCTWSYQT